MTAAVAAHPGVVALVGNPNVGKSTLFNALTASRQRVSNYPGVTVSAREGDLAGVEGSTRIIDLPGSYSLRPNALDEAVVLRCLTGAAPPDAVIVVLDVTNLRRNLFLLTEVIDLGLPLVVALNMVDEARRGGIDVPTARLRETLGVPVVETVGITGEGLAELREALAAPVAPQRLWRFEDEALEEQLNAAAGATPWARARTLAADQPAQRAREVAARYAWIGEFLAGRDEAASAARSERIDRVLLHPILGPLFFLVVMGLVFQSIFTWAGPLMDLLEGMFEAAGGWAGSTLPPYLGELGTSLITDGVIAGVGSVVVFLPQIVILFLLLGLLEDTGYMARAAFLVDRPLQAVGLSGRSFIPILSSFACAIPGVMATRTIPDRFERLLAVFVAPLMTCSARLPVYVLLIAAFIPDTTVAGVVGLQGLVLFGLYLAGLLSGAAIAFVASRRKRRGKVLPLVVELPPYRRPLVKAMLLKLRVRVGDFLRRAGTVIFVISVVLWFLVAFPRLEPQPGLSEAEQGAAQVEQSYAGRIGKFTEPLVQPLGYDWRVGVGVLASFAAREVFVGTMGIIYSVGDDADEESEGLRQAMHDSTNEATGRPLFSLATVCSLLAFFVFALQCGATVAVVRREANSWRFALGQLVAYLVLAYLAAFVTYQGLSALGYG